MVLDPFIGKGVLPHSFTRSQSQIIQGETPQKQGLQDGGPLTGTRTPPTGKIQATKDRSGIE